MKIQKIKEPLNEMARIGFVPVGTTKTVEVYVHTDDSGNVPHFHVRKYGTNNKFEWETCIRYDSPTYFYHGRYVDKIPDKKIIKQLDSMLRSIDPESRNNDTFWNECVDEWNRNNSEIKLDKNIEQPDYTKL